MSVNCFLWGGSFLYDAMPVGGTETSEVQPILGGNLTTSLYLSPSRDQKVVFQEQTYTSWPESYIELLEN